MKKLELINIAPYTDGAEPQKIFGFESFIDLNNKYLRIENRDEQVILILNSGIATIKKEHEYNLSNIYIPYNEQVTSILYTPFSICLLKALNSYVASNPPNSKTSFKNFTSVITVTRLLIEYFSLNGALGLADISKKLIDKFKLDIELGWYKALNFTDRFNLVYKECESNWFEIRSTKTTQKRFAIDKLNKDLGSSLFNRSLNEIPSEVVSKLNIPNNLRTTYSDSSQYKSNKGFGKNYYKGIFLKLNNLFFYNGLTRPIMKPEKLAKDYSTVKSNRTRTPDILEVTATAKFLFSVITERNTDNLRRLAISVKEILLDETMGTTRIENAMADVLNNAGEVLIQDSSYKVQGYNQVRNQEIEFSLTIYDLYKTYVAAIGGLSLLFTGWRLNEVVDKDLGLHPENFSIDYVSNFTVVNRYVEKESIDEFKREKTAIGPVVGRLLKELHKLNLKCAIQYDSASPLFSPLLAGRNGGSKINVEFSSKDSKQNPLYFIARKAGINIPSPREYRRLFATLYFYQFDYPELLALSQHYAHEKPEVTEGYVTDYPSRKVGKSIANAIPVKNVNSSNDSESKKIFDEARDAKLKDLVLKAIQGETQGGFQATCRALWRKLFNDVEFSSMKEDEQEQSLDMLFGKVKVEGYSVEVFQHANCTNSDKIATSTEGHCSNQETGKIEREHASGIFCSGCAFQDVHPQHVENLKIERDLLLEKCSTTDIEDLFADNLTPLEIEQAAVYANELSQIISLYDDGWH